MGHVCLHDGETLPVLGPRVVQRVTEADFGKGAERLERLQVCQGAWRIDHGRQRAGVRCNHQVPAKAALERQVGHAERPVLVRLVMVPEVVRAFAGSPRHAALARVGDLPVQNAAIGLVQQREGERTHNECRQQVLEHAPTPRQQSGRAGGAVQRARQPEPVLHRHVVPGDRDEARQARLRGQQIVEGGIRGERVRMVTDREQLSRAVVQEREVHLRHEPVGLVGQCHQPLRQVRLLAGDLQTGLLNRDQVSRQVPAVHDADIRRVEDTQAGQPVPVVEVAAISRHDGERRECPLETLRHVGRRDQTQVARTDRRQQLQSDVGGRRSHRHLGDRIGLDVVRRQPAGLLRDVTLEELPMLGGITRRLCALRRGKAPAFRDRDPTEAQQQQRRGQPQEQDASHESDDNAGLREPQPDRSVLSQCDNRQRQQSRAGRECRDAHRRPGLGSQIGYGAFHQRRRLPLQQPSSRYEQAIQRSHDGVGRQGSLVRQCGERDCGLLHIQGRILCHRRIVRPPGAIARRPDECQQKRREPRRSDRYQANQRPSQRRARQHRPAPDQKEDLGDFHQAAAQVVQNFPLRQDRQPVWFRPIGPGHDTAQPRQELPITADPAVFAPRGRDVTRRILIVDDHVGGEAGPRVIPLDQVVRQQRVFREAAVCCQLEGVQVVDALAGEAPLAKEILVHVGDGGRVRVHTRVPRRNGREARAMGAWQGYADSRLQYPVPVHDATECGIVPGPIERVGERAHERCRRIRRQHGIGVERDDVPHVAELRRVAADGRKGVRRPATQEPVEVPQLAALALPSHPDALPLVPAAGSVQQVELVRRVPVVEGTHPFQRRPDDLVVLGLLLRGRVRKIAEDGVGQAGVAIGEKLHFEVLERFTDVLHAAEQRGDHHRGTVLGRHLALLEVQPRQHARRQPDRHQLIEDRDRHVERRQRDQREHQPPGVAHTHARRGSHGEHRQDREQCQAAEVDRPWIRPHQSFHALARRRRIPGHLFQFSQPVIDQVEPDVRPARIAAALRRQRLAAGQLHGPTRHRSLPVTRTPGNTLDDVAILVARRERHLRVEPRGILAERGFHHALFLDEHAPVATADVAQAVDAVRHHDLRQRQPLRRLRHRVLGAHTDFAQPVLEPRQRRRGPFRLPQRLQERRHELRCEPLVTLDKLAQGGSQLSAAPRRCGDDAIRPS